MGMYDDIKVSRSYLKDLLTKKQEAILKQGNDWYQTKDLENVLSQYKIYRRKLWKDTSKSFLASQKDIEKPKPNWELDKHDGLISFYTTIDVKGDIHWFEFQFIFKDGVIDTKELIDYTCETKEDIEKNEKEWGIINTYIEEHFTNKRKVKLYNKLSSIFLKLYNHYNSKTQVPRKIKEEAYKAAGRDYNAEWPLFK